MICSIHKTAFFFFCQDEHFCFIQLGQDVVFFVASGAYRRNDNKLWGISVSFMFLMEFRSASSIHKRTVFTTEVPRTYDGGARRTFMYVDSNFSSVVPTELKKQ